MTTKLAITKVEVGPIGTNCYILAEEQAGLCAVIDPGDEPERVAKAIEATKCKPAMILLTHGHFDHYTGVKGLLERYPDLPVYIHPADATDAARSELLFPRLDGKNQRYYKEGDTLHLGALSITVMETPGHSKGSVCLVTDTMIFCGDTLFRMSCGRTDFPGGDYREILQSLKRLAELPGDYACLPGHMESTTLDFERGHNPYMKQGMTV